jgi:hypothetical protein
VEQGESRLAVVAVNHDYGISVGETNESEFIKSVGVASQSFAVAWAAYAKQHAYAAHAPSSEELINIIHSDTDKLPGALKRSVINRINTLDEWRNFDERR